MRRDEGCEADLGKRPFMTSDATLEQRCPYGCLSAEAAWRGKRAAIRHSSSASDGATEGRKRARQARPTVNSAFRPRLIAFLTPIIVKRSFGRTKTRHVRRPFPSRATGNTSQSQPSGGGIGACSNGQHDWDPAKSSGVCEAVKLRCGQRQEAGQTKQVRALRTLAIPDRYVG